MLMPGQPWIRGVAQPRGGHIVARLPKGKPAWTEGAPGRGAPEAGLAEDTFEPLRAAPSVFLKRVPYVQPPPLTTVPVLASSIPSQSACFWGLREQSGAVLDAPGARSLHASSQSTRSGTPPPHSRHCASVNQTNHSSTRRGSCRGGRTETRRGGGEGGAGQVAFLSLATGRHRGTGAGVCPVPMRRLEGAGGRTASGVVVWRAEGLRSEAGFGAKAGPDGLV